MPRKATARSKKLHEAVAPILGRTPSGIFILTAADAEGRETGMLVSWVQQASFDPPMVTVAVNKERFLNDWLRRSPELALSLVGESQTRFLKHFARGFDPGEPAFDGVKVIRGETGLPLLASALGWLEGRVAGRLEAGDHFIYLVEITGAGAGEQLDSKRPMVHIRRNGFRY